MTDYSKNTYCETWEDENGNRIDIAWTWYEMKKMPVEYRVEKRRSIFERYGFDYKHASKVREWFFDENDNIQTGED